MLPHLPCWVLTILIPDPGRDEKALARKAFAILVQRRNLGCRDVRNRAARTGVTSVTIPNLSQWKRATSFRCEIMWNMLIYADFSGPNYKIIWWNEGDTTNFFLDWTNHDRSFPDRQLGRCLGLLDGYVKCAVRFCRKRIPRVQSFDQKQSYWIRLFC